MSKQKAGVLRAALSRDGAKPQKKPMALTPQRAVATGLGRAAEALYKLPLHIDDMRMASVTLADFTEYLPERALFLVVEGEGDALGVVALGEDVVSSLIEVQTIGRLSTRPAPKRKPTRTDAVICADFVNRALAEILENSPPAVGLGWAGRWRFASVVDDPRPLALMLEDVAYRALSVDLSLGRLAGQDGARGGQIVIMLPEQATLISSPPVQKDQSPTEKTALSLRPYIEGATIRLEAVLCRKQVSLGVVTRLKPGAILPLGADALTKARLETKTGFLVAEGKLGEAQGCHAIRLGIDRTHPAPVTDDLPLADLSGPDAFRSHAPAARDVPLNSPMFDEVANL